MTGGDRARAEEQAVDTVRGIIERMCAIPPGELTAGQRIADLDIDSVLAAEILVRIEQELDIDIDVRRIVDDWSGLTLRGLALHVLGDG
jgi:acyl carrier protein